LSHLFVKAQTRAKPQTKNNRKETVMTTKRTKSDASPKKLTLNKETIRDLTPGKKQTNAVRGGFRSMGCQLGPRGQRGN
jgi:hypothetical protein